MGAAQVALVVKNPPANAEDVRDTGSIPESGRSPGEGSCQLNLRLSEWDDLSLVSVTNFDNQNKAAGEIHEEN